MMFSSKSMNSKRIDGFRSQLEWQWALVFSQLRWNYQYEPKTFRLKSGYYLPDFLVDWDGWQEWFEIKSTATSEEVDKCRQLSELISGKVYLLEKFPSPRRRYKVFEQGERLTDEFRFSMLVLDTGNPLITDDTVQAFWNAKHCVSSYESERQAALSSLKKNGALKEVHQHLEIQGWHDYLDSSDNSQTN